MHKTILVNSGPQTKHVNPHTCKGKLILLSNIAYIVTDTYFSDLVMYIYM